MRNHRAPSATCVSAIAFALFGIMVAASVANADPGPTAPPQVTFLDPVPALLSGSMVTTNVNVLASKGRAVQGVDADGATELVLRIPAASVGEQFTLTVLNDSGQQSQSSAEDGGLGAIGSTGFGASQLTVTAVRTRIGPIAFAIYGSPVDFPRPEGQDVSASQRAVSIQSAALDTGMTSTTSLSIVRPPVVLVHGLWGSAQSWSNFTPFTTDPRFFIGKADYSRVIGGQIKSYTPSYPSWATSSLATSPASSLGFAYNAPAVLKQINGFITQFKSGKNPANVAVAAIQADIIAHSMGGDITRTLPSLTTFYSPGTFTLGTVHKLITIATPHWGSPLAIQLLNDNNECVRGVLALSGSPSFTSVTFKNGMTVNGAVNDLQGDGFGGSLSTALLSLQNPVVHPLHAALIQGLESQSQLDGLDSSGVAISIRILCFGDYLADHLTSSGWPAVFGQDSDSIVPALSEVAGLSGGTVVNGVIHSASAELLGFGPPAELDSAGGIPNTVVDLLNTPVTDATYIPLPQ